MKISKEVLEKILIAMTILAKAVQEHINNTRKIKGRVKSYERSILLQSM